MAFCTSCGAPVEGRFCTKCGAAADGPAPAPPTVAATAPLPTKKKVSPLVWILVSIVGVIVLVIMGVFGFALYFAHKVKQNPAMAFSRIVTRMNPDLEVLSSDTGRGTLTVRDKKTGKVVTMNFDDMKRGRFTIQEDGKEAVTVDAHGAGDTGSVEIRSGGQVARFGAGADQVPSWVPRYPGAKIEGNVSGAGGEGQGGTFAMNVKDPLDKVLAYYESALKGAGFTIPTTVKNDDGGMIMGQNNDRTIHITVSREDGQTSIATVYSVKK